MSLLAPAVQSVQADSISVGAVRPGLGRHVQGVSSPVRVGDEFSELLLGDFNALAAGGVAHLHHGPEQVERVGHVCAAGQHDEEDKEEGVAED